MFKFSFSSIILPDGKSPFRAHNMYAVRMIGGVQKLFDNKKEAEAFQAELGRFLSRQYAHVCFLASDVSQMYFRNYMRMLEMYRGSNTDKDAITLFTEMNKGLNHFSIMARRKQKTIDGPSVAARSIIKIAESLQGLCNVMLRQIPAGIDKPHIEHIQEEIRVLINTIRLFGITKYTNDMELSVGLKTMPPDWLVKEILNS